MPKAKEFLQKLGLEAAEIDNLLSADAAVVVNETELADKVFNIHKTKMENDGTFEDVKRNAKLEVLTTRDKKVMAFYKSKGYEVTQAEYDALPKDSRADKLIELIQSKIEEKLSRPGDQAEKDKEIARLNGEVSEWKSKYDNDVPAAEQRAQSEISAFKKSVSLRNTFSRVNAGKLVADENVLWPGIESQFNEQYDTIEHEGKIVPVKKGTTNRVFDGNKEQTLDQIIEKLSDPVRKKSDDPNPGKKRIAEPEGGKGKYTGASRAEKLRAERLEAIEKNK